jgi:hypothetical protein
VGRRFVETGKGKFSGLDEAAALDLLAALDAATALSDLSPLKSIGLHELKGDRKGQWAMIVNGKRGVSPETALRLGRYFGNSARFWLNLQIAYELALAERELGARVSREVEPDAA